MGAVLEKFAARANAIVPGAPLHRLSHVFYAVVAAWIVVLAGYFAISDFRFGYSPVFNVVGVVAFGLVSGLCARRYGMRRIASLLECVMVLPLIGATMLASTAIMARHSSAFIDARLRASDAALGFDWLQLFAFYQRHPGLMHSFDRAYNTLLAQIVLVPLLLYWGAGERRLWRFLTAWLIADMLTLAIFPFATASGPMSHYGITPAMVPELSSTWQWEFAALISNLRSGAVMEFSQSIMGIVQFPSFHAAAAIMLGWAGLQLRWWGLPLVAVNLAMLFATLINGDHYLTDVLAGTTIGLVSLWASGRVIAWQAARAFTPAAS